MSDRTKLDDALEFLMLRGYTPSHMSYGRQYIEPFNLGSVAELMAAYAEHVRSTDAAIPEQPIARTPLMVWGVCIRCNKNPAQESHMCPYAADINDDSTFRCTCCTACTDNCAEDV